MEEESGKLTVEEEYTGLLTKAALAKRLGVGIKEINRRIRTGSLREMKRVRGALLFHPDQVEEQKLLTRTRTNVAKKEQLDTVEYSGEEASTVFRALHAGKTLHEIVIENTLHPAIVEAASRAYAHLQGGLYLTGKYMAELEKLPIDGEFPVSGGEQLVEMLREALTETACAECKRKARKVCLGCARSLARKGKRAEDEG